MGNEQDLLRKIQGLIAKAEGTDNENEASAFYAKANELMTRYAIDEMTVRASLADRSRAEKPVKVDFMYSSSDSNAVGKRHLLNQAAMAFGVKFIDYGNQRHSNMWRPGNTGVASQWGALIGFATDIEAVKLMYVSLLVQDSRFAGQSWREQVGGRKVAGESKFRTGHLVGFSTRVGARLREAKQGIIAEAGSSALIVLRDDEVAEAVKEFFPHLGVGKRHAVDFAGQMAGRRNGERADIGNSRMAAGARQIGGGR